MNYLREFDKLCHTLSLSQARIFERSVEDGIPSYTFIKSFMLSSSAKSLDELNLESTGLSEIEIYEDIKDRIKTRRGKLLPYPIIRFIGYFYRSAAYMSGLSSKYIFNTISVKYLENNYLTLHSLSIVGAVNEVFDALKIEQEDKTKKFIELYKEKKDL